jgi:RNA polymerase sigma-70 factor (ECF subfamily)
VRTEVVERLFEEHAQQLFAFLVYRTGDRTLAEDLVADTFERVMRSRQRFNPLRGSEQQWIYAIALNLVRDHARRSAVERRATEQVAAETPRAAVQSQLDTVDTRDELQRALETLNEGERDVIALRFGADLTLREVAGVLKQGESATEGRLYRALGKLRERLQ